MGKLDGKVVIVTGSSRDIGAEIARLFASEGGKVICASRTAQEGDDPLPGSAETTVGQIREAGGEATAVVCQITIPEDCERLVKAARDIYGPVDVLVNNAAQTMPWEPTIKDYPLDAWMTSWSVNLHAPFLLSKLVLDHMIPRGSGSIVNIGSRQAVGPGRGPYPDAPEAGAVTYGTTKAALERFTQGLAMEVYRYGVSVTCVAPSVIVPSWANVRDSLVDSIDDTRGEFPEYLAKAALLLASEPLDKVTGRVCYSQQLLLEYGLITEGRGTGVDPKLPGSGYAQI